MNQSAGISFRHADVGMLAHLAVPEHLGAHHTLLIVQHARFLARRDLEHIRLLVPFRGIDGVEFPCAEYRDVRDFRNPRRCKQAAHGAFR